MLAQSLDERVLTADVQHFSQRVHGAKSSINLYVFPTIEKLNDAFSLYPDHYGTDVACIRDELNTYRSVLQHTQAFQYADTHPDAALIAIALAPALKSFQPTIIGVAVSQLE